MFFHRFEIIVYAIFAKDFASISGILLCERVQKGIFVIVFVWNSLQHRKIKLILERL